MAVSARRRWLRQLIQLTHEQPVADVVVAVADRVVRSGAQASNGDLPGDPGVLVGVEDPPDGWGDPWLIGAVHELLVSSNERSARGAWYTPPEVVGTLVAMALPDGQSPTFIIDPTCGGGAFLLAALDRMVAAGRSPSDALSCVGGMDIDAGAVEATRLAIEAWGRLAGVSSESIERAQSSVQLGDQLEGWPSLWPQVGVVLGNPPFATPLRGVALSSVAQAARSERSDRLGPYADLAAIHLAVCVERVGPGGRIAMVLPQSILASRDTADLRRWIDDVAPMHDIWATKAAVFEASVRVWAPLLVRADGSPTQDQVPTQTQSRTLTQSREGSWSMAAAAAIGVPAVGITSTETLGSLLTSATAGFRDEFYALAEACVELAEVAKAGEAVPDGFMRLATVGSLDPLASWWGRRPTKFAKKQWHEPVIDIGRVEGSSSAWLAQMQVPKVLLPTQSRVFEPFVDRAGIVAPATPLLALFAEPEAIDLIAAVLLAPPVTAWAFARWFGSAMSVDAIKVAARDLAHFPLPPDRGAWAEATSLVAQSDGLDPEDGVLLAIEVGRIMNRAYGADADVETWWLSRVGALVPSTP